MRKQKHSLQQTLHRRERQILDAIFRRGGATVAEVIEELPDPPSYSAVRATLRTLVEKGHLRHEWDGPRYVYKPTLPPEEVREDAVQHLVHTFFGGSTEDAMMALLRSSDAQLSDSDLMRLAKEIKKAKDEGR